jgi:uncharacterized protein YcbK (DUF882 family)
MLPIGLRYFELKEFKCREGREYPDPTDTYSRGINPLLLAFCDELRHRCGFALHVNSGYRNPEYNAKIGGEKNSYHMLGCAADLSVAQYNEEDFQKMYKLAKEMFPPGLGYYPQKKFIHIDVRSGYDHLARWIL